MKLRSHHGSNAILRVADWLIGVMESDGEHCILGRPLLFAIGCNYRHIMDNVCDSNDGSFVVLYAMKEEKPDGLQEVIIAKMFTDQTGV